MNRYQRIVFILYVNIAVISSFCHFIACYFVQRPAIIERRQSMICNQSYPEAACSFSSSILEKLQSYEMIFALLQTITGIFFSIIFGMLWSILPTIVISIPIIFITYICKSNNS